MVYAITLGGMTLVWLSIIILNERFQLLRADRFPSPAAKYFAYAWLGVFLLLMAVLVSDGSHAG